MLCFALLCFELLCFVPCWDRFTNCRSLSLSLKAKKLGRISSGVFFLEKKLQNQQNNFTKKNWKSWIEFWNAFASIKQSRQYSEGWRSEVAIPLARLVLNFSNNPLANFSRLRLASEGPGAERQRWKTALCTCKLKKRCLFTKRCLFSKQCLFSYLYLFSTCCFLLKVLLEHVVQPNTAQGLTSASSWIQSGI